MQILTRAMVTAWLAVLCAVTPLASVAAPFAAFVMDARTGKEIYSQNADARLHPASLTKMMTLYMAFTAIEQGKVRLDSRFIVSPRAAAQPPSRLGLRAGQQIELRYLIRAAAVKSANDAATVIGEGLGGGSEARFAQQMTAMARALGMRNTSFRNANGLTVEGHFSSARDLTLLGRRLFYDFPQYYPIFSRRSADAGIATVASTNKRFLDSYDGADGIKTGYTRAAGFNLTASAQRGPKRIVATVLGGQSTAQRNAIMAQLLDAGFGSAPNRVQEIRPAAPAYLVEKKRTVQIARAVPQQVVAPVRLRAPVAVAAPVVMAAPRPTSALGSTVPVQSAKPVRRERDIAAAVAAASAADPEPAAVPLRLASSDRPTRRRPAEAPAPVEIDRADSTPMPASVAKDGAGRPGRAPRKGDAPRVAVKTPGSTVPAAVKAVSASAAPPRKSDTVILAALEEEGDRSEPDAVEIVARPQGNARRNWGVSLGRYKSQHEAEQVLLRAALQESGTLDGARRSVANTRRGFEARFTGMTRDTAQLVCGKMEARALKCSVQGN